MSVDPRRWTVWAAIGAGALAVALVAGRPPSEGPPLDPDSSGPSGTKALVATLRGLGAHVAVGTGAPDPSASSTLVLSDRLSDDQRAAYSRWVERGGTLVVTDPSSPLAPARPVRGGGAVSLVEPVLRRQCPVPALRGVEDVTTAGAGFPVSRGVTGCFVARDRAWLLVAPRGRGHVVATGGPEFLTNEELGEGDNAVLAAALLAPRAGSRAVVLRPDPPGTGDRGLVDLVPSRVKLAGLQLLVAFGLLAWWRARRLGRPVAERRPVEVRGSDTVAAVADLLQRARARDAASEILSGDLRHRLVERLGLPADTSPDTVAQVAARRTGVDEGAVARALAGPPVDGEAGLVEWAQEATSVADRVLHAG